MALARTIECSDHADKWTYLVLTADDADYAELVEDLVERDNVRATLLGPNEHFARLSAILGSHH